MKIGRWIVAALLVAVLAWGATRARRGGDAPRRRAGVAARAASRPPVTPEDSAERAPAGVRVRVQVVNATRTRGLARRATRFLRDRGFDVVEVSTQREQLDSSVVLDRSGHPDWARRAARAMGGARIVTRPDTLRYLDLTVLVGRAWRAPAETLDP